MNDFSCDGVDLLVQRLVRRRRRSISLDLRIELDKDDEELIFQMMMQFKLKDNKLKNTLHFET